MLLVGSERDGELVLGLETIQRRDGIGRNAENIRAGSTEGGFELRKVGRLLGATGRIGSRVEIKDELAPGIIGK